MQSRVQLVVRVVSKRVVCLSSVAWRGDAGDEVQVSKSKERTARAQVPRMPDARVDQVAQVVVERV